MSWQVPRTQEARHRGVQRTGRRVVTMAATAIACWLAMSSAMAADAPAAASAPKPTPVQGPVLVPPVGMTGASGVTAVPPQGDMLPRLQMSAAAVTANKAANGGAGHTSCRAGRRRVRHARAFS